MKEKLAYLSGYIDGDGCFYLSNYIRYRSKIIISSTVKSTLKFFKTNFGGTIREVPRTKTHWKPQFHWCLGGKYFRNYFNDLVLIERQQEFIIFKNFIESTSKLEKQGFIDLMKKQRIESKCINENIVKEIKNIPTTGILTDIDFAYLAGFIDAECCFSISKEKPKNRPNFTYKIYLKCNNTNPTIFYWLKEKLGGSIIHIKRKHLNKNHNDQICWTLSGKALSKILPKVFPFLISKKLVCQKLIEFYNTTLENGGDRQSSSFKEAYERTLKIRESIVNEIHILNSKGANNV